MNRIDRKFTDLGDKKALITFITGGDPDISTTKKLVCEMAKNGADIIEIGVPFSDPIAEGPTIQASSKRSIDGGTTLAKLFQMVVEIRKETEIPLIFMMYLNSIFRAGIDNFFKKCQEVGIDGVIIPDMPYEENGEILPSADKYGVYSISLVTPTSKERIAKISKNAKGFLYCVSSTGVTGVRSEFLTDFQEFFATIKSQTKVPAAIGFGISNVEQAEDLSKYCDGVIVGSAIVKIIEEYKDKSLSNVIDFVKKLKIAIN